MPQRLSVHSLMMLTFLQVVKMVTDYFWSVGCLVWVKIWRGLIETLTSGWGSFWERSLLASWFSPLEIRDVSGMGPECTWTCEFRSNSFNFDGVPKIRLSVCWTPEKISLSLSFQSPVTPQWYSPLGSCEQLSPMIGYSSNSLLDSLCSWLLAFLCFSESKFEGKIVQTALETEFIPIF